MPKLAVLAIIATISALGAYYYFVLLGEPELSTQPTEQEVMEQVEDSGAKLGPVASYTLDEVAQHADADDCWLAIEGKVYDVTPFIASQLHPGGEAILEGCGTDATELFNTRPMGTGTPHSEQARANLSNFEIGVLTIE